LFGQFLILILADSVPADRLLGVERKLLSQIDPG
jgi:hypothetical protein